MNRRIILLAASLSLALAPLPLRAQQAGQQPAQSDQKQSLTAQAQPAAAAAGPAAGAGAGGAGNPAGVAGAAPAAAAPTTAPAPPRKITVPPGFKPVSVNGRTVLCEDADAGWVTTALAKLPATTKPATMPATLLEKLTGQREALLRRMAADLALRDLAGAARMYDVDLVGTIRMLDQYKPPVFYLAASPDRLAALMRNGWSDPHFYYNRAADAVTFNPAGSLTADRPQDEAMFPAAYDPKDPPEKRSEALTVTIGSVEASIRAAIEIRCRSHVASTLAYIVQTVAFAPLKLKDDQAWISVGTDSYLSATYLSMITGDDRNQLLDQLSADYPANPLKTTTIDVVHPQDPNQMRPEALPAYFEAYRRKSLRVVRVMVEKGGDQAIPKAITAIGDKKPIDGAALMQTVKEATGVDLTPVAGRGG